MKTLKDYIKESIFDIEDKIENFDRNIWNELLKPLNVWRVASDNKTIIYDPHHSWLRSPSLHIEDKKLDIKSIADADLIFQPVRDLQIYNYIKDWELIPATSAADLILHVILPHKIDLSGIKCDIEAKLMINVERDMDNPEIIPPIQHLNVASLSTNYRGYDLNKIKNWDCELLCILSQKNFDSILWDGFHGYDNDKIVKLVENNPKAKTIYLIPNSYDDVVYRIQTKGTGKNKKCSGLLPVSRKSLINRIDKYNNGTFKYMSFRNLHKELFE